MRAATSLNDNYFYEFGEFRLDMRQRVLFRGEKPVSLTPKVWDTLAYLVANHNRLIEKNELMNAVWADSFVEEGNLTHNIRVLRKTLGDDAQNPFFIETVPRRGYRFIAPVEKKTITDSREETVEPIENKKDAEFAPEIIEQSDEPNEILRTEPPPLVSPASPVPGKRLFWIGSIAAFFALAVIGFLIWQSAKNFVSGGQDRVSAEALSFEAATYKAEKLTNAGRAGHAAISPDGKLVAYTNNVGGRQSLWLRQLATNTNVNVVPPVDEMYFGMRFSHDGAYLYFVRGGQNQPTKLYRVPVVGGKVPVKVLEDLQGWFALSPDDKRISYIKNRPQHSEEWSALMIADADGGNERKIASRPRPRQFSAHDFSPDGQHLVAAVGHSHTGAKETELIEFNANDGTEREISPQRWFSVKWMEWSPQRNQIVMTAREKLTAPYQLWRVQPSSGEARQFTNDSANYSIVSLSGDARQMLVTQTTLDSHLSVAPAAQPDGERRMTPAFGGLAWLTNEKLVYSTHSVGNDALWTINSDGTGQEQLTFDESGNIHPATVKNRFVFYVSDRAGVHHIWRVNADGSEKIQLTRGDGEQAPAVTPDGNTVFYHTVGTPQSAVWKTSSSGGEPIRLTENHAQAPSVSPDGASLAYFSRESADSDRLLIVVAPLEPKKFSEKRFKIAGGSLSALKIRWTPDSKALTYAAETSELVANIWLQPLDGGAPQKLTGFSTDQIFDFDWSPDGKQLAAIRGAWNHSVVLLNSSE
jgi:Tol biopolymer transport system component/DNA-binding winged helix-turn-helix (wHTH) protein